MKIDGQEHPEPNATLGDVMRILARYEAEFIAAANDFDLALDRLSDAQKTFDERVDAIRGRAPNGSFWRPDREPMTSGTP